MMVLEENQLDLFHKVDYIDISEYSTKDLKYLIKTMLDNYKKRDLFFA